jgi:hypothetical protein
MFLTPPTAQIGTLSSGEVSGNDAYLRRFPRLTPIPPLLRSYDSSTGSLMQIESLCRFKVHSLASRGS